MTRASTYVRAKAVGRKRNVRARPTKQRLPRIADAAPPPLTPIAKLAPDDTPRPSKAIPEALRLAGGTAMSDLLDIVDAAWKHLASALGGDAPAGYSDRTLARFAADFGFAELLTDLGGIDALARPDLLADLPRLQGRSGTDAMLAYWIRVVFDDVDVVIIDVDREPAGVLECSPPRIDVRLRASPERIARVQADRARLELLVHRLVPAHVLVRAITFEEVSP